MNRVALNIKSTLSVMALSLLCCQACAQKVTYSLNFEFSKENFTDSIDIEFKHNQIVVPVKINGHDYRFLLDTGASQGVIITGPTGHTAGGLSESSLERRGTITAHDAIGNTNKAEVVVLPPLTIGKLTIKDYPATIQHSASGHQNIDGIIGFDIFCKGLSAKIDTRSNLLILTDHPRFFANEPATASVSYKLNLHVPYINVSPFDKFSERTLFDTGSPQLYAMNKNSFDRAKMQLRNIDEQTEGIAEGRHAMGHYGAEKLSEVVFLALKRLKIAQLELESLHTMTTQGDSHIGASILNHAAVTIDSSRKRITFQTYNDSNVVTIANKPTDIAFINENGKPTVGLVRPDSEPYNLGFREGDIVTGIDKTSVTSTAQFILFDYERGREYVFHVKSRSGEEKQIRWIRLPL